MEPNILPAGESLIWALAKKRDVMMKNYVIRAKMHLMKKSNG